MFYANVNAILCFIVRYFHFKYLQIGNSMIRDLNSVRLVKHYIDKAHFYNSMMGNVCIHKNRCEIAIYRSI